jgi:hypothetical protein
VKGPAEKFANSNVIGLFRGPSVAFPVLFRIIVGSNIVEMLAWADFTKLPMNSKTGCVSVVFGHTTKDGERPSPGCHLTVKSGGYGFWDVTSLVKGLREEGIEVHPTIIGFPEPPNSTEPLYTHEDGTQFTLVQYKGVNDLLRYTSVSPQFTKVFQSMMFYPYKQSIRECFKVGLFGSKNEAGRAVAIRPKNCQILAAKNVVDHRDTNPFAHDGTNCEYTTQSENMAKKFDTTNVHAKLLGLWNAVRSEAHPQDPTKAAGLFIMFRWVFHDYKRLAMKYKAWR